MPLNTEQLMQIVARVFAMAPVDPCPGCDAAYRLVKTNAGSVLDAMMTEASLQALNTGKLDLPNFRIFHLLVDAAEEGYKLRQTELEVEQLHELHRREPK